MMISVRRRRGVNWNKVDEEHIKKLAQPRYKIDFSRNEEEGTEAIQDVTLKKNLMLMAQHYESMDKFKYKKQFLKVLKEQMEKEQPGQKKIKK